MSPRATLGAVILIGVSIWTGCTGGVGTADLTGDGGGSSGMGDGSVTPIDRHDDSGTVTSSSGGTVGGGSGGSSAASGGSSSGGTSSSSSTSSGSSSSNSSGSSASSSGSGGPSSASSSGASTSSSNGSSGGSSSSSNGGSSGSGSGGSGTSSGGTLVYDGTVGKTCQANSDCEPLGGPGVNVCSNTLSQPLLPTPVCVNTSCDPLDPSGNGAIQFCDGVPTDTTAPGLCVPTTNPIQKGMGVCLPKCLFGPNFSAPGGTPNGCQGKDTCNAAAFATDNTGAIVGVGYCFGGCVLDTDCPSGSRCQVDEAICVKTLVTRTKTVGQACSSTDATGNVCNCDYGAATGMGICTQSCIVGGAACPAGYACDSGETTTVPGLAPDGGSVPGFSQQTPGLAGLCLPTCASAGATCPANLRCIANETVGPVCSP